MAQRGSSTVLATIAVGLAILIYALDATAVSTAAPTIIGEFHALGLYGWLFSSYSIPATSSTLLYGRLADTLGRKRLFTFVMLGFLLSSVGCGLSTTFLQLIVFRALQGAVAGATFPLAVAIIADVFPIEKRAKGFAVVPATYAFSSVSGPVVGGLLTDGPGWRWIFFINVPIIFLAIGVLHAAYREEGATRRFVMRDVDVLGSALLATGLVAFLGGMSASGLFGEGGGRLQVTLVTLGLALLVAFIVRQQRAASPLLPLRVVGHRGMGGALGTIILIIWIVFTLVIFIPSFAQGVLGASARNAGIVLIPLMLAWSVMALVSLRIGERVGFRTVALGGCVLVAASLLVLTFRPTESLGALVVPMLLAGLGTGMIMPSMQLLGQNSLSDRDQGLAGGLANCTMNLAASLVAPLLGALEVMRMSSHFGGDAPDASALMSSEGREHLTATLGAGYVHRMEDALGAALHDVFLVGFAALALLVLWLLFLVPTNDVAKKIRMGPLTP